jgi:thiol:disulfide interchange protein DsbD
MFKPVFSPSFQAVRVFFVALVALLVGVLGAPAHAADDDFLGPEAAFRFSAAEQPGAVELRFKVADGYYLYRERFAFAVKAGEAALGTPTLPAGHVKYDDTFAKNVETYRGDLVFRVPVERAQGPFDLVVTSQGCADKGICYPPAEHVVHVSGAALHAANVASTGAGMSSGPAGAVTGASFTERFFSADYAQTVLEKDGFLAILGFFFAGGIVLSLFPCSLPMIPIVSSILVGEGAATTRTRSFALSASYVLGMALVFSALGVVAALAGQSLGGWLQNAWVLGTFAVLIAALACLLIAGVDLQLPQSWQSRANAVTQRQHGGRFAASFVIGALSALVVGACMTAPLAAILLFIAHTGSMALGAAALFAMGCGNGVPLVLVGLGAGAVLPRAGVWMDGVKRFFGMLLLAVALWLVSPVAPIALSMLLAALWLLLAAAALHVFERGAGGAGGASARLSIGRLFGKGVGAALAVWAVALVVGVAAGSSDPLRPLAVFASAGGDATTVRAAGARKDDGAPPFARVASTRELDAAIQQGQRATLLDFYADWCVSCKEMEKSTFSDPEVRERMASLNLLRADVTANNGDDQMLLKRFKLFGPPGIIFFDARGNEVGRVVGFQSPSLFLKSIDAALRAQPRISS